MEENCCRNFTSPPYVQVLFCYEQFDELTLLHLREFDKKKMISVETDIVVDHYKEEKFEDSKPGLLLSLVSPVKAETCGTVMACSPDFLFLASPPLQPLSA